MRRMLPFILINIFVSAAVVLGILYWWDSRQPVSQEAEVVETAVSADFIIPTSPIITAETATLTPTPTEGPPVHIVVAGDTLGRLSEFYGVTVEDIMAANGMDNPNIISVGQQLIIPVGGVATAIPENLAPTAVPSIIPTPLATAPAPEEGQSVIKITEVVGIGDLQTEAVQIINEGTAQQALFNWRLIDEDGRIYLFGQVTIFGEGAGILLHSAAGRDGATDLYWGQNTAVWQPGEQVTLLDANGNIQATFTTP